MIILKPVLIVIALYVPEVKGSSLIISDDRVRNLDANPVLGRGFTIGTNSLQLTCLNVDNISSPSYNYDRTWL